MTQDTEDVVADLRTLGEMFLFAAGMSLKPTKPSEVETVQITATEASWTRVALSQAADLIQSLSDRIDVLEANVVELWHESEAGRKALHEYLGMSWEEYIIWATPRAALHQEGIAP